MSIATIARRSQKVLSDHSPAILTGAAIAGTIVTAIFAGRAGYKAGYSVALDEATGGTKANESDKDRRVRIAKDTWKLYLPSAVTGVGTIAAVAAANRINTNRAAALAAAYTITDRAFSEYKSKVVETIGEKKQTEIQDKILQDRMDESGERSALVMIGSNNVLCYDAFSDRYFQSSMEDIKKAQNDTNYELLHNMYVSLSEFYSRLGLPSTGYSDELGWTSDNKVDLHFSSTMTPDERPALSFTFHVDPIRNYHKSHA